MLAELLRRNTTTPEHCYFGVWEGFGALRTDIRKEPTFTAPGRGYHLLTGPLETAAESILEMPWTTGSPNLWWPEDRAWCVATEIDLNSTYVGCDKVCRDDLLESRLEAYAIDPSTGIDRRSDRRN